MLLDTALSFAKYVPEPFIAPMPIQGEVEVYTMQNNVPLRYTLHGAEVGWWQVQPRKSRAVCSRHAEPHEIVDYLNILPRFYVIACIPSGEQEWLVVPFNSSDAQQRGWRNGEPQKLYMVNEHIEPYDVIVARRLGRLLLYDSPDYRLSTVGVVMESEISGRDWSNAYSIITDWYKQAEEELRKAQIKTKLENVKDRFQFMLEFMGASLVSSEKKGNGYIVRWQAPDTHIYRMSVKEDGRILVAGFCLNGTDEQHNLSSIVQVMDEAHRLNRPDVRQAYADYDEEDDYDD